MRGVLALALVLGLSSIAAAASENDRAAAREHFQKGTKFFDLGKFEDAVKEYEAAYELIDDPVLLYNIAQAHRLAGHTERALFFYRSFLRRNPNAKNQDEVNLKIAELQKALDQQAHAQGIPPSTPLPPPRTETTTPSTAPPSSAPSTATTQQPPAPAPAATSEPTPPPSAPAAAVATTPAPVDRGRTKKLIGFGLVGLGGAALIGAIVSTVLSKNETDAITTEAMSGGVFDPAHEHASQTDGVAAGVLYGIGGAALAAGGVMIYLGYRDSKRGAAATAQIVPDLSPQRAGARAIIRF